MKWNDTKQSINMNLQSFCLDTIISLPNIIPPIQSRFYTTAGIYSFLYINSIHLLLEKCNTQKNGNTYHVNRMCSCNQLAVNPYQNYICVAYIPYIITYLTYTVCHTSHTAHMYSQSLHMCHINALFIAYIYIYITSSVMHAF